LGGNSTFVSDPGRQYVDAVTDYRPDELSLFAVAQLLLRHRRFILSFGIGAFVLVLAVALFRPRTYTSTAAFMPQAPENALSRLSGLAAQLGALAPISEPGSSPAFYASLLKSRDVLRQAVLTPYAFVLGADSVRRTLIEVYRVSGDTPQIRRDAAVKRLAKDIDISTTRETGVVSLEVTTPWATLSQQVASRMIGLVSQFNLQTRQTRAGAERRFVESRLQDARASLHAAEDRLQAFLQENREFRNAPRLLFENDRLRRDIDQQQQVYTSLAQAYEQARIDEVRNTPVITILESPDLPARPDPRRALLKGLLGLVAGVLISTLMIALRNAFAEGTHTSRAPGDAPAAGVSAPRTTWPPAASTAAGARSGDMDG
jgi:uncharacterized protein involved in exopolysaccharide biosynthesis